MKSSLNRSTAAVLIGLALVAATAASGRSAPVTTPTSAPAIQRHTNAAQRAAADLVYQITGTGIGIRFRNSPHWNDAAGPGGYDGDNVTLICGAYGDPVGANGNPLWHFVQTRFGQGWLPDHYLTTPFLNWNLMPGEPACGQTPTVDPQGPTANPQGPTVDPQSPTTTRPSGLTAAESAAMNWARVHLGQYSYEGYCLAFVFNAYYYGAGVGLRPWVNVAIGGNTYPIDIWGHFTHGMIGTGVPPAGALVFFANRQGIRTLSHVTLSLGGGRMVSTEDSIGTPIHIETLAQHSYARELGWWLPDR